MAIFPCDWAYHRYPGKQRAVYVNQLYGSSLLVAHALRLCEQHLRELLVVARTRLAELEETSALDSDCTVCGERRDMVIFVKAFGQGEPAEEFAADFCREHGELVAVELRASNGRRLAER